MRASGTNWQMRPLGELATTTSGGTPSRTRKDYYGGSIPWVKSGELNDDYIFDTEERITEAGLKSSSAKLFPSGTVLIALYGATVGKTSILRIDASTNQAVCGITPGPDLDGGYLRYHLISLRRELLSHRYGGAQPNISQQIVRNQKIAFPPLPEQKKIAHILSTVQRAIEAQERIIQTTTELKKALMHKLFTEGLRHEPQKQTEIGPVPESWEVVPLATLIRSTLQNGAFVQKPQTGKGFLFANVVDMYRETHLNLSSLERLDVPADSISQYWLKDGDILVVRSSLKREGIGQNCVARNLSESVFYDCHLIRVQTDPRKLVPEFLSTFWRSDIGKNDLVLRSKTTTMTTINQQGISKALVPVAPIDEQSEIVDLLETVDAKIRGHRAQKQQLEDLFRTLLHELMTAKTRVHEIETSI